MFTERKEVKRSIGFFEHALEASKQQVLNVLDQIKRDDLPKECYKNYIKGLTIIACFSKSHTLPKLITEKLYSLITETNQLEKEVPPREISNKDFSTNVESNQANLKLLKRPYQQYYDENLNKREIIFNESQESNYALRELGLFRDVSSSNLPPLPFRPFLIAESLAFTSVYNHGKVGKNTFNFLSETFKTNNATSYEADSLKFSIARGLSQTIIHNDENNLQVSKKAFNLLLAGLFSHDANERLITKEAVMRIAIEKPEEFFKGKIIANIIKCLKLRPDNIGEAIKILEVLALNAPDKIKSEDKLIKTIDSFKKQGNENWRYFDYFLHGDTKMLPLAEDARTLLSKENTECLIIHNIRESLGDEWIRQKNLLQGLLASNQNLKITIVSNKPFLYNLPRINSLDINDNNILNKLPNNPDMVFNQYYEGGAYSEEIQKFNINKFRNHSPIYMETACEANFHDAFVSYISLEKDGKRSTNVFNQTSLENLYAMTLKLCANIGMPVHHLENINILCGKNYPPAENGGMIILQITLTRAISL